MKVDLIGDADGVILTGEKLQRDVLPELRAGNGWIHDKLEGFAVSRVGSAYSVTDNDGVDDSSGGLGSWDRLFR